MSFSINYNCEECGNFGGFLRHADNGDIVIECLSCGETTLAVIRGQSGKPVRKIAGVPITTDYVMLGGMGTSKKSVPAQEYQGRCLELHTVDQGEFKFIFLLNPGVEPKSKYYMKVLWNPERYEIVDFIAGRDVYDIDEAIESIKLDMRDYVNGARIACERHIEDGTDPDGVYKAVLDSWDYNI